MKIFIFFIMLAALVWTADSQDRLAPGETWTYTRNYTVQETDICQAIQNNVTVNAIDPCSRKVGPAVDNETVNTTYRADIRFDKVSNKSRVLVDAGDIIGYTYYVENTGDVNLTITSLADDMIFDVQYISGDENRDGVLNPGEMWSFAGAYKVVEDDLCRSITNEAELKARDPCNNQLERTDEEVVETVCGENICCQDGYNRDEIISGDQFASGVGNADAKNNVDIKTCQEGID